MLAWLLLAFMVPAGLGLSEADARVEGDAHRLVWQHRVFGGAATTGNTLMQTSVADPRVNSFLLNESSSEVRGVPFDAELVGAYLFWSGSIVNRADRTVRLQVADGTVFPNVGADTCMTVQPLGGFFYCRSDVTGLLRDHPGAQRYNGSYTVGDLEAEPGFLVPDGQGGIECADPQECQAKYAAWSLIVVYEANSARGQRDVFIYDGFRQYDETAETPGIDQFQIQGFDFPVDGRAKLSYFGMEGDLFLGVPPQDTDPLFMCETCFDFLALNGTQLSDGTNPAGNLFNSSTALGVDLEGFDVSALIPVGANSARIRVGSGDGIVDRRNPEPGGGGEMFMLGYVLLDVDRNAPNFRREGTVLSVVPDEGAPRERVVITLRIANEGTLDATNAQVRLALPDGLTYFPGSLRLDGQDPVPGEEAVNPLRAGFGLGRVPFQGDNDRLLTFRATIAADAMAGQRIISQAFITATELEGPVATNEAILTVLGGLELGQVSKTVVDGDGDGRFAPGELITYQITVPNPHPRDVGGVQLVDQLPPSLELLQVVTLSGEDNSDRARNRVQIDEMVVPGGGGGLTVTIIARLRDADGLVAAGVPAGAINGFVVANRARITAAGVVHESDDPTTAAAGDTTNFAISAAVEITGPNTLKSAADINGGLLEPGDLIRFTIQVANQGTAAAEVFVSDPLPNGLEDCVIESAQPELLCAGGRLQGFVTVPPGGRVRVVFVARVSAAAAHDTIIQNVAQLRASADPNQQPQVTAEALRVIAAPSLTEATKRVLGDGAGVVLPGERLRYEIRVPNTGNRPATDVVVRDPLPFDFVEVVPEEGGQFDVDSRTITWRIDEILPGETATVHFEALLPAAVADGTTIDNQARLSAAEVPEVRSDDPATAARDDATRVVVRSEPRLVISKTVQPPQAAPGDEVLYRIEVRNEGTDAAANVRLQDVFEPQVFADLVAEPPAQRQADTLTWAVGALPVGASAVFTVRARLGAVLLDGLQVPNQVQGFADGVDPRLSDDPSTPEANDPTLLVIDSTPALLLEKRVEDLNGGDVQPGDQLRYVLTLRATGDAPLVDVVLRDPLPNGLVDPAVEDDTGALNGNEITWALPGPISPLDPPLELSFVARVPDDAAPGSAIANRAFARATGVDEGRSDDPATAEPDDPTTVVVVSRPDLTTSTKTVSTQDAEPGEVITWQVEVINSGNAPAEGVVLTDPLPADLELVDAGGAQQVGDSLRWAVGAMAPRTSQRFTFTTRIQRPLADGVVIANQATVAGTGLADALTDDPSTPELDDATRLTVRSAPELELVKAVEDPNGAPVRPGDLLRYVITVRNTGGRAAEAVRIEDDVPNTLSVESVDGGVHANGRVTWALGALPIDAPVTLAFTARVQAPIANGTVIANQALVRADDVPALNSDDPRTAEAGDPTRVQVVSGGDLSDFSKSVEALDDPPFHPGGRVRYTLLVRNQGDDVARGIVVRDALPAQLGEAETSAGAIVDGALEWRPADLPVGASARVVITARIVFPLDDGTEVANRASATIAGGAAPYLSDDPNTDPVDATRFVVRAAPLLTLSKTIDAPEGLPLRPGDGFDYVLELRNSGDADAIDVVVTDVIPEPLEGLAVAAPGGLDGRTARWQLDRVQAGSTVRLLVRARVPAGAEDGLRIANQAQAGAVRSDDPSTPEAGDATVAIVRAGADFTSSPKTVEGAFVPGGAIVYTVEVRNRGTGPATNVNVLDAIPEGITVVRTVPEAAFAGRLASWRFAEIAAGASQILRIEAVVDADAQDGQAISNQAQITATDLPQANTDDPEVDGLADPTVFVVQARAELRVSKSVRDDNGGAFEPGDPITYILEIANDGAVAAQAVEVVDPLDPTLVQVVVPDGAFAGGIASWLVDTIEPGAQVQLEVRARIPVDAAEGHEVRNQFGARLADAAFVRSDEVVFTVQQPNVAVEKTVVSLGPGGFQPGTVIEYRVVVRNQGDTVLQNVVVADPLDLGRLEQIEALDGGIFDAQRGTVEWGAPRAAALARIEPGASVVLRVRATLLAALQPGDAVDNQATAVVGASAVLSDDPTEPGPADVTQLIIEGGPAYDVRKDVVDPRRTEIQAGDEITYRIEITNQGSAAGQQVTLLDALPPELIYVPGSTRLDARAVPDANGAPFAGRGLLLTDALPPGGRVRVEFSARVRDGLPAGTVIANQAEVRDGIGNTEPSDDPTTPIDDDPTRVTLGGRPDLGAFEKRYTIVGGDGSGRAQIGDIVRWELILANQGAGPATDVEIRDAIPARSRYEVGSLRYNGARLTDQRDGDDGEMTQNTVRVQVGVLPVGGRAIVEFRTRVEAGPTVENRGFVTARGEVERQTQRVVVPVGEAPVRSATLAKTVTDPTGPPALASERLIYELTVANTGTVDLAGLTLTDDLPPGLRFAESQSVPAGANLQFVPPPAGAFGAGQLIVTDLTVATNARSSVRVALQVDPALDGDRTICNSAQLTGQDIAPAASEPACVDAEVRYGRLQGTTFEDRDGNATFTAEVDVAFVGMRVAAYNQDDPDGPAVAEALTDEAGGFELRDLRPSTYRLRAFSSTDTLLKTIDGVVLAAPEAQRQDVLIDPTGRIYDSVEGDLLDGAEVFIHRDDDLDNDDPFDAESLRLRVLVPPEDLEAASQQGQRTAHGGVYQFGVRRPGRYVVEVVPPGPSYVSPSVLVPSTAGLAATEDPTGRVVDADLPTAEPDADRTYFLAFELRGAADTFTNNHIPVDPLSSLIDLQKRAARRAVTIGSIVSWTVDITNRSPKDLVFDPQTETGGVFLQDVMPKGLKYVAGSTVLVRVREGAETALAADDPTGARILRFGQVRVEGGRTVQRPMDLHAGEHLRLRYQAVVGADAKPQRNYTNRAVLLAEGNVPVSRTAKATVRVLADPDFDQGFLLGRVYCDANSDGRQSDTEAGLAGARIYMDHGYYAVTDSAGQFHFKDLDPGTHAIKIDRDSLLPGAQLTTDELRVVHFTRGLPAKVDFGVTCPSETVQGAQLELAPGGLEAALKALRSRATVVVGSTESLRVRAGRIEQIAAPIRAQLEVRTKAVHGVDLRVDDVQAPNALRFRVALAAGAPRDRWTIRVGEVGQPGHVVAQGSGAPPIVVPWSGRALDDTALLQPGKAWWWQLEVADTGGHLVASPVGVVGVDLNGPPEPELITRFASEGLNRRPSRAQRQALEAVADRLRSLPGVIVVEAHTDSGDGPLIARRDTRKAAQRIAAWLANALDLPAERFEAVGQGNSRPIVPNLSPSSRRRNRRIEIRHRAPRARDAKPVPVPRPERPALVRIDAEAYPADQDGRFAVAADVPPDGVVEVWVQATDGRRAVFPLPIRPGSPVTPSRLRTVAIEGQLPDGLRVGGAPIPLDGLNLEVRGPEAVPLQSGELTSDITFTLTAPMAVRRWRLTVLGPDGGVVYETNGVDQPGADVIWPGPATGRLLPGLYRYQLTARLSDGVAQSAEGVLRLGGVSPGAKPPAGTWQLLADGRPVQASGEGKIYGTVDLRGEEAVLLDVRHPSGARRLFFVRPPAEGESMLAKHPTEPPATAMGGGDGGRERTGDHPRYAKVDGLLTLSPQRQPLPASARAAMAEFGRAELLKVLSPELGAVDADVPARTLTVQLPAAGAEVGASVPVRGQTAPGNLVELNGVPTLVNAEGQFSGAALLPTSATHIEVVAIDPQGNRGVIRRPVKVRDHGWFLLALGESQLGFKGAELDGVQPNTSVTLGDTIYLHGRAAVYFKGHQKGTDLLGGLFEHYEATAHLDTAKQREDQVYFKQLIDPEAFYPVYGDAAQETKDVNSRGPVYVLIKADRSTLQVGNFRTQIRGVELLNYDRTLYGAALHLNKKTGDLQHELRGFASDVDTPERHAYVELRGTGGSLYYLPHRELIEGSERLYVVERDKISNLERQKVLLTRNVDYTVRYEDGRVLMKKPVPSVSLDGFGALPQPNSDTVLDGHPVYLGVEYDHRDAGKQGDIALGVHARETYNDTVSVGAGFIQEGRSGALDYTLWGADLRLKHKRRTRFEAEFARSQSTNAENLFSADGGLTFQAFNGRDGLQATGSSFLVRGGLELDDLIGAGERDQWYTEGYWQYLAPGFYSGGAIQQQGLESYGALTRYVLNTRHQLRLQHDGTTADAPLSQGEAVFNGFRKEVTRVGHLYQDGGLKLSSELVHTQLDDGQLNGVLQLDVATSGGQYALNERWTLLAEQEVVLRGDERLHNTSGDLLASTVGVRYRASKALEVELTESLRWSGDNATQLGVRTEIDERHTLYGQQRLMQRDGSLSTTTVLGGEERWGADQSGRLFGEYQLESGSIGERNRAVMGVGKRTQLVQGLMVDAGYQRSQVVGGGTGEFSQDALSLGLEWLQSDRLKVSGRYEMRYEDNDETIGRRDRLQLLALNSAALKLNSDITLLMRANFSHTIDLAFDATEAELIEGSLGIAWRPVRHDWFALIAKYTKRYEQRPTDLSLELPEREEADVVSVVGVSELPYRFQLVEKLAWKRSALRAGPVPAVTGHTVLWINRLNYHLTNTWDAGAEYRLLRSTLAQNVMHGTLVELNYIIQKTVRLGAGYNFTSFSDDEFSRLDEHFGGPFFRVVAHY
jgi:uncharacterized repeat protein (TIGR01451 family)